MAAYRPWILIMTAMLLSAACSLKGISLPKILQTEGEQALSAGVWNYEKGNYKEASKYLREALNEGLRDKADQIKAYKYLAFIDCTSGRKKKCASEFRKAFKIDPNFKLEPAEAGHPIWGPVFRIVKARMADSP